jgi:hypothetical protein
MASGAYTADMQVMKRITPAAAILACRITIRE